MSNIADKIVVTGDSPWTTAIAEAWRNALIEGRTPIFWLPEGWNPPDWVGSVDPDEFAAVLRDGYEEFRKVVPPYLALAEAWGQILSIGFAAEDDVGLPAWFTFDVPYPGEPEGGKLYYDGRERGGKISCYFSYPQGE